MRPLASAWLVCDPDVAVVPPLNPSWQAPTEVFGGTVPPGPQGRDPVFASWPPPPPPTAAAIGWAISSTHLGSYGIQGAGGLGLARRVIPKGRGSGRRRPGPGSPCESKASGSETGALPVQGFRACRRCLMAPGRTPFFQKLLA